MAAEAITPQMGFALVLAEQVEGSLAYAAKILARFAPSSEECRQTALLLAELGQRVAQHRTDLLKQATGGIVIAQSIQPHQQ